MAYNTHTLHVRSVLQQPLRVTVGVRNSAASSVKQRLLFVGREAGKLLALRQLIREGVKPPTLVFVGSKVCLNDLDLWCL
jgi:ATP-dependent RNA helicase DDX52/ROK1